MYGYRNIRWLALAIVGMLVTHAFGSNRCVPESTETPETMTANVAAPSFLSAWVAKYPASTLPTRMAALTGSACNVCHHPSAFGDLGNCYRADLITLLGQGRTISEAIDQLHPVDSDGDGVPNGEEATTPRPEVNEIGYNMGLIGDTGTDPCATNPTVPVSGLPETPPVNPIPTVSHWGLVVLVIVQVTIGSLILRGRQPRGAGG